MQAKFGDDGRIDEIQAYLTELGAAEGIAYDFDADQDVTEFAQRASSPAVGGRSRCSKPSERAAHGPCSGPRERTSAKSMSWPRQQPASAWTAQSLQRGFKVMTTAIRLPPKSPIFSAWGVRGVPTFILEQKYAVSGAQEVSVLADALRDIAEEKAFGPKM